MIISDSCECVFLGQAGFLVKLGNKNLYIDPYLSNSVQKIEGDQLKRNSPVVIKPENIRDASYVLITHEHLDHCDLETLIPIKSNNPSCIFIGPYGVIDILRLNKFEENNLIQCDGRGKFLENDTFSLHSIPAAHPELELNSYNCYRHVGYVIDVNGVKIYHSGDTCVCDELIQSMKSFDEIDYALLPVNEDNYYKRKNNIIGNMSIREAFTLCEEINAKVLIPTHWDMFKNNMVYPQEIELLYELINPVVELKLLYPLNVE